MSSEQALRGAVAAIRAGRVVAFPTETVYGLGADALDPTAVLGIYTLKGRPRTSPLIVHVLDTAAARALAADWPDAARRLAAAFWPGPLTLIVPKAAIVPEIVTAGLPTVGLRVPAHPVARALLAAAGRPLAAPSANVFTRLSATRAEDVRRAFPGADLIVLDGGPSAVGIESTVVALDGPVPRLLRPGAITAAALRAVVGTVDTTPPGPPAAAAAHSSPGQHARHYSPRTRLVVVTAGAPLPAGRVAWVHRGGVGAGAAREVRLPGDPAAFAAALYATLHDLDDAGFDVIAVEAPPADDPAWEAVRDRLRRASASA